MYGYKEFVVALGYKGHVIKDFFFHQHAYGNDFTVDLKSGEVTVHQREGEDWQVTLVDTGESTMTGGRLLRLRKFLTDTFFLTYGDGLANVDIDALLDAHRSLGLRATVTAVRQPPRFGALREKGGIVTDFAEKAYASDDRVNGGYFVMEPDVIDEVTGDDCVLESGPLTSLASRRQLAAYVHNGFWQPMDTLRERDELERLWISGNAPWLSR